jgi:hypothetical protein
MSSGVNPDSTRLSAQVENCLKAAITDSAVDTIYEIAE